MAIRSDAPRNLQELRAWNIKHAALLTEWQMQDMNRRWGSMGKMLRHPAALFEVKNYN